MNVQLSRLQTGAQELGLHLPTEVEQALLVYLRELSRWNHRINLSGIRDLDAMVTLHALDSLSIYEAIRGETLLDVGSGAGLPGIPLALIMPERNFWLLDSSHKRTGFLTHIKTVLKLDNVTVVNGRVEQYQTDQPFDTIMCRAFANLATILNLAGHLCAHDGQVLAMKGKYPDSELTGLPSGWFCEGVQSLGVPGVPGERHLVVLKREFPSNSQPG